MNRFFPSTSRFVVVAVRFGAVLPSSATFARFYRAHCEIRPSVDAESNRIHMWPQHTLFATIRHTTRALSLPQFAVCIFDLFTYATQKSHHNLLTATPTDIRIHFIRRNPKAIFFLLAVAVAIASIPNLIVVHFFSCIFPTISDLCVRVRAIERERNFFCLFFRLNVK